MTFETWLRRNTLTAAGRTLLALGIEAVFACEPGDVSLLHVLFYAHSAGSFQMAIDTGGGAQQDRFVGGSQLLCDKMAEALGPGAVHLDAPVRRISVVGDRATVVSDDGAWTCRRVIVSVPPLLAGRIDYDPPCRRGATSSPNAPRWARSSSATPSTTSRSGVPTA